MITYHVINNKGFLDKRGTELKNKVYDLWQREWAKIYAEKGSTHSPKADGFFRYDVLSCLFEDESLIGFTAHSFFDLKEDSSLQVEFFENYGQDFKQKMTQDGIHRMMTIESLLVDPQLRKNFSRVSYGRVIVRLGNDLFNSTNAQAMSCIARCDNKVSQVCQDLGYKVFKAQFDCRGFPCDSLVQLRETRTPLSHGPSETLSLQLWQDRHVHGGEQYWGLEKLNPARPNAA